LQTFVGLKITYVETTADISSKQYMNVMGNIETNKSWHASYTTNVVLSEKSDQSKICEAQVHENKKLFKCFQDWHGLF